MLRPGLQYLYRSSAYSTCTDLPYGHHGVSIYKLLLLVVLTPLSPRIVGCEPEGVELCGQEVPLRAVCYRFVLCP
eukprot:2977574-Pleurochrysis_carterae.AAC.5